MRVLVSKVKINFRSTMYKRIHMTQKCNIGILTRCNLNMLYFLYCKEVKAVSANIFVTIIGANKQLIRMLARLHLREWNFL